MLSIDWLGMTATVVVDYAVQGVIVVDTAGNAVITEVMDMEVVQIDLVEFILSHYGPNLGPLLLEQLLEIRALMLSYQDFMDAMDEYEECSLQPVPATLDAIIQEGCRGG